MSVLLPQLPGHTMASSVRTQPGTRRPNVFQPLGSQNDMLGGLYGVSQYGNALSGITERGTEGTNDSGAIAGGIR